MMAVSSGDGAAGAAVCSAGLADSASVGFSSVSAAAGSLAGVSVAVWGRSASTSFFRVQSGF